MRTRNRLRRSRRAPMMRLCAIAGCGKLAQPTAPFCPLHQPLLPFPLNANNSAMGVHRFPEDRDVGPAAA